jgi:hypothetical protein
MGVSGYRHDPAALPPEKTRYPLYRRLGGPQGRSGQVRKISSQPGFEPRMNMSGIFMSYVDIVWSPSHVGRPGYHYRCPSHHQHSRPTCSSTTNHTTTYVRSQMPDKYTG